jgi:hypothetical protein
LNGLLLDHTFSAAGAAFAREFEARWNDLNGAGNFTLMIVEKPEPRGGTRAWIEFDGEAIVVVPLSPGRPAPAQAAVEAAFNRALDKAMTPKYGTIETPLPLEPKQNEPL